MSISTASTITLDNHFARHLPEMGMPWQAAELLEPQLLVLNEQLASDLGLDAAVLRSSEGIELLTGNRVPAGATPVAQAYAGHQFGGYSPRLGDGRALLLGEITGPDGSLRDIHLKGSGRTPFARGGDGLAAVGPMLREYIVSEGMSAMGIPTTRSLAVTATGRPVQREELLPGAVLTRVAASHLRVGTFQYARATGDLELLRRVADYAIARHFPHLAKAPRPYPALLESVIEVQASLVAQWMLIGFVHGVMNTDNMTISGETIDYGPCAFMDSFNPSSVYSSIDTMGRYAYANQPLAAQWNLTRFAETLLPLLHENQDDAVALAEEALNRFPARYSEAWSAGMGRKLGLADGVDASELAGKLLTLLEEDRVDYTSFLRSLSSAARGNAEPARAFFMDTARFDSWLGEWHALNPSAEQMDKVNPIYVPRNHLVEEALAAASDGDLAPLETLLAAVTAPFEERSGFERYALGAPDDFGSYRTFCGT
ncbi:protein adenylyltransferase SelO family protein [Arthrobacter sp.]|uniref:protein adenylyltransferase SelO n=1 Tax=Arthrobacter sp. TaxID=1667 RepID=UPI002810D732|nr:YdiU family protein [Arthrobacter sp.]